MVLTAALMQLSGRLSGELFTDEKHRILYATDASAYREKPIGVAIPKNKDDLFELIQFANKEKIGLIPRTAGTSLAGQVVGSGLVVDVSRNFTEILEFNAQEQWVRVQPGVIRDELNMYLKPHGFLFGPETSTANRAMIGGMVGNNSCGSNSVMYGSTRDHLLEIKAILADGNEVEFKPLSKAEFEDKLAGKTTISDLEQAIYQNVWDILKDSSTRQAIKDTFPLEEIRRRNNGYALDQLMLNEIFGEKVQPFNFCKLIAGSEGTLCFITEIKIHVEQVPPPVQGLLCVHFNDLYESLESTVIALKHKPGAVELMDKIILDCTKHSKQHKENRFFLEGDPKALLVIQILDHSEDAVKERTDKLTEDLKAQGYGYHYPLLTGDDCTKVWDLRKAGLGLLSNIPGDEKPVPVIEDTAVCVPDLRAYIEEFNHTLKKYNLSCVHYAHAGSGELHLRPILNLKTEEGKELFRTILQEIATLVKKYRGSLSGEHGDGRLRGEFIPFMYGEEIYQLFRKVKYTWDPDNIFNPNKIVDTPPMNESLRYFPGQETPQFDTAFRFDEFDGYLRTTELCNGSADCRKTELTGGTMCPTYMATRDEAFTTRARANMIREHLTRDEASAAFTDYDTHETLDHCISCKGCKKECPSSVDMAKLKAEFEHQYQLKNGIPFQTRMVGHFATISAIFSPIAPIYNAVAQIPFTGKIIKKTMGFAPNRSIPKLHANTMFKWANTRRKKLESESKVLLYADEFTNYNDSPIGITAIQLLEKLGYQTEVVYPGESGRAFLSKGMLDQARNCANKLVNTLSNQVNAEVPLIGIEPSTILSFRDEYPDLVDLDLKEKADHLAQFSFTIEEFLAAEMDKGKIKSEQFTEQTKEILIHGHCHQKALSNLGLTRKILSLPKNYQARLIPSGCCGMAGSFGYLEKNYDLSMKIGELVLFPAVRNAKDDTIIAASGTSCRHQIADGTEKQAFHPVEILYKALK